MSDVALGLHGILARVAALVTWQGDGDGGLDPGGVEVPGGLSTEARWFVALMGVGAVVFILVLLRRRQLQGKYALLWTGLALVLGLLGLFPGLLTWVSEQVGIYYPPALFLLVASGFLFAVVIQFSWELSRLTDRSRRLAEEVALLRAELTASSSGDGTSAGSAGTPDEDAVSGSSGT